MLLTSKEVAGSEQLSPGRAQTEALVAGAEHWPGIDSRFQLVIVVTLRRSNFNAALIPGVGRTRASVKREASRSQRSSNI